MIDFMTSTRRTNEWVVAGLRITLAVVLSLSAGCSTVNDLLGRSNSSKSPAQTTSAAATGATTTAGTDEDVSGRLRTGDEIVVHVDAGAATMAMGGTPNDVIIDDQGNIELPLVGQIKAAGLTTSELAEHIQSNYVPRYYVRCTATVLVAQRFFYVGGEVRSPGRFPWSEDTTVMKAINTAGGFTDYANRGKVQLARGKEPLQVFDCQELQRNPAKDAPVRPGDTITVPRSVF
jgi:protein involved in polysaccharide export with SLBB domain